MKKYNVGIIGATGMVGQRFSLLLDKHPWFNVVCVAALATMDVLVERNAYGRQLGSFRAKGQVAGIDGEVPLTFIRAPRIVEVHGNAQTLANVDGRIVAARQGNQLGVTFHPELDEDTHLHELFLQM